MNTQNPALIITIPPRDITKIDDDHAANKKGCKRFKRAMLDKLDRKQREGRGGWNDPEQCSVGQLRKMLCEHVERGKGDMVDIANFAMMIWNREHPTGSRGDE